MKSLPFLMVVSASCRRDIIISPREQLSCLDLLVLPCYLLNRGLYKWGHAEVGLEMPRCRAETLVLSTASASALGTYHPCTQAILANDKVTTEVTIVLKDAKDFQIFSLISWVIALNRAFWFRFLFFLFGHSYKIYGYRKCHSFSLDIQSGL